jgi:hypothetical protein
VSRRTLVRWKGQLVLEGTSLARLIWDPETGLVIHNWCSVCRWCYARPAPSFATCARIQCVSAWSAVQSLNRFTRGDH